MAQPAENTGMVPVTRLSNPFLVSRLLATGSVVLAVVAAGVLLWPRPLADVFYAVWVLATVALAGIGAIGAWTRRSALMWVAALLLAGLSILGMWSFGLFVAPAAVVLLGAAVASYWTGPQLGAHKAVLENPPSVLEAVLKTLAGTALVVVGAGLTYEGAIVRELFTRGCARETLECALAVVRWDGAGLAVFGLAGIGTGGWLVWRQVAVGRVLASTQSG